MCETEYACSWSGVFRTLVLQLSIDLALVGLHTKGMDARGVAFEQRNLSGLFLSMVVSMSFYVSSVFNLLAMFV